MHTFRRFLIRQKLRLSPWLIAVVILFIVCCVIWQVNGPNSFSLKSDKTESEGADTDSVHVDSKFLSSLAGISSEIMKYRVDRYNKYQSRGFVRGPGERGEAVRLAGDERAEADRLFKKEAFNIVASDKIALDRSVKDTRESK